MTTRIPISTDDRPFGSDERSRVLLALSMSVIMVAGFGIAQVREPLWTGDYRSLPQLLRQAMGLSAILLFNPMSLVALLVWFDERRLSVHVDTAQGNLVLQTTRLFGYRRVVRIDLADVQSVAVHMVHSENDQCNVVHHQVWAFCKGTRPPVLIANLDPAQLSQAEAIAQRLRDALKLVRLEQPDLGSPSATDNWHNAPLS